MRTNVRQGFGESVSETWVPAVAAVLSVLAAAWLVGSRHRASQGPVARSVGPTITVGATAYEEGLPAPGRTALFHDDSGKLLSSKRTNDSGVADGAITAHGSATLMMGGATYALITYYGLKAGERGAGGESEKEQEHGELGTVHVELPSRPANATLVGATLGRDLTAPNASGVVELQLVPGFVEHERFTMMAEARVGEERSAYALMEIPTSAFAKPVHVAAWRTDWASVPVRVSGLAQREGKLSVEVRGKTAEMASFSLGDVERELKGEAEVADSVTLKMPKGLHGDATWELKLESSSGVVGEIAEGHGLDRVDIPFGARALPSVKELRVIPSSDPARPTVRFAFASAPSEADFVQVRLVWGENDSHVWDLVLPPTEAGEIRVPEIPASFQKWAPTGEPKVGVGAYAVSYIAGYSALVRRGIEEIEESDEPGKSIRYSVRGVLGAP